MFRADVVEGGLFGFGDEIAFAARYGTAYRLLFSLRHVPEPGAGDPLAIANITSDPIEAMPCPDDAFFVPSETRCRACVAGAFCNGTATLLTREGYWRHNTTTLAFMPCPEWLPSDTCRANYTVGTCRPDFSEGPLCAVCVQGRAGRSCDNCTEIRPATQLALFGSVYFMVFSWTTLRAFMQDATSKRLLTISVWKRTIGSVTPSPRASLE